MDEMAETTVVILISDHFLRLAFVSRPLFALGILPSVSNVQPSLTHGGKKRVFPPPPLLELLRVQSLKAVRPKRTGSKLKHLKDARNFLQYAFYFAPSSMEASFFALTSAFVKL